METLEKIPVGISACLLGLPVRYDGGHKHSRFCTQTLAEYFEFHSLCPEAASGLSVPRPTMHLKQGETGVRLVVTSSGQDHTALLADWCAQVMPGLASLCGFILTPKSPSCGVSRIRVFNDDGNVVSNEASGLFAAALMQAYPLLPVEESGRLNDPVLRENFIERVFVYAEWQKLIKDGLTAKGLLAFHRRHKFQLLAHNQKIYRQLGPLLSNLKAKPLEVLAQQYIALVMEAMESSVSRGDHVNALQHVSGFLKDRAENADIKFLHEQIAAYQREEVPLIVPMTLMRGLLAKVEQPYLEEQGYLAPYPDALGLRNKL